MTPANLYNVDYSLIGTSRIEPLIRRIRNDMAAADMKVEDSKGECNLGQHEINFRYGHALRTADKHVIYKTGAKEIAAQEGMSITFMAKYDEREGSSCHIHLSLQDAEGTNLFDSDPKLFDAFLAGQLAHLRELTLFLAPNVNSYKRFAAGSFAPTTVAWGRDNRTCSLRVIGHGPGRRFECRAPGADVNPYLALAGLIAAGLAGVDAELELEPAFEGNAYASDKPHLPTTLRDARDLFASSSLARSAFGDDVCDHYLNNANVELAAYDTAVTDGSAYGGSSGCEADGSRRAGDARGDLCAGAVADGVRGDARTAGNRDQARPAAAGRAAPGRARAVRAAWRVALDPSPGAHRARAVRTPACRPRPRRWHLRVRPPAARRSPSRELLAHWRDACDVRRWVGAGRRGDRRRACDRGRAGHRSTSSSRRWTRSVND